MILVINICKEKLHFSEFVKPIQDILIKNKIKCFTKHYSKITKKDLVKSSKVIICGTSLQDDQFLLHLNKFEWILNFDKPLLGICGGMQIIGLVFGGSLKKKTEIGFFYEKFKKEFLDIKNKQEVYHLHNNFIEFSKEFEKFTNNKFPQAIKHKEKIIYGCLFHPEVRQKQIISNFCKIIK